MTSAAILIGLNAYPKLLPTANLAQLSGAVHDCQDVAQMLLKHQLIDPDHLYAFVYDTDPPGAQVPGAKAFIESGSIPKNGIVPRGTLADALEKFIPELGDQGVERLFVYLSGHGGDLTMAVPPLSVLLTSDYRGSETNSNQGMLVTDHIQNLVHNAIGIREAIIISDSCRSSLPDGTVTPVLGPAPLFKRATRCLMIKATVHSTPSTEDDVLEDGRVVGTFTHLFLKELDAALTNNKDGKVLWRDICDAVATQQTNGDKGQLLDYQQVTAYPLMEVRAAPAEAPNQTMQLRDLPLNAAPNKRKGSDFDRLESFIEGFTVNSQKPAPDRTGHPISLNVILDAATDALEDISWTSVRTRVEQVRETMILFTRRQLEELGGVWPQTVDLESVYRFRPLINGVIALNTAFNYLLPEEREHLQQAIRILATEGDPWALERLNGAFSRSEWEAVTAFLRHQAHSADPLSTLDAPARADGFTLEAIGTEYWSDRNQVRVTLKVQGTGTSHQPNTVRVYQHPSQLPVIQDVAFTDGAATVVLFTRFAVTVAVKVDGGPLLKLDLAIAAGLPRRPKTE